MKILYMSLVIVSTLYPPEVITDDQCRPETTRGPARASRSRAERARTGCNESRLREEELLTADRGFYSWTGWDTAQAAGAAGVAGANPARPAGGEDSPDGTYLTVLI